MKNEEDAGRGKMEGVERRKGEEEEEEEEEKEWRGEEEKKRRRRRRRRKRRIKTNMQHKSEIPCMHLSSGLEASCRR